MGARHSAELNITDVETSSEWLPSSICTRHTQAAKSEDTCIVNIAANAGFDITYRPTFKTLFSDKDTILYQSFAFDCHGKQLPSGIFSVLEKSSKTLKSLTLTDLPHDCRVCIYDLFRKLHLQQYQQLDQLVLTRRYKDECYIRIVDDQVFPSNLTQISLYGIGLVTVPANICQLKYLTRLSIANNIITRLDCLVDGETFFLRRLVSLDAAENLLSVVPGNIDRLATLKVLNLSHNCLKKTVPDSIGNLHNLTNLFLQWNRLEEFPFDAVANLKSLEMLNLAHNKLKQIDTNVCFHHSLRALNLAGNGGLSFHQVADTMSASSVLQELDISSTALCFLPSFVSAMNELTTLECQNNRISNIDAIITMQNLQKANFRSNNLSDCSKILNHLSNGAEETKLLRLDLSFNQLVSESGQKEVHVGDTLILLDPCSANEHQHELTARRRSSKPFRQNGAHMLCC